MSTDSKLKSKTPTPEERLAVIEESLKHAEESVRTLTKERDRLKKLIAESVDSK